MIILYHTKCVKSYAVVKVSLNKPTISLSIKM